MRQASGLSFPHPVIGNGDDARGSFDPSLTRSNDRRVLNLEVQALETGNEALGRLVEETRAKYVVRVECGATGYREVFSTTGSALSCEVPLEQLHREVEVEAAVIAVETIADYRPSGVHPDYGDAVFEVEPGDVLAVAPGWRLNIAPEWDPLKAPVPSLMRIVKGDETDGPMDVILDNDKILVRVCQTDYERYLIRKGDSSAILHASIVLPVLVHAISKMEDPEFSSRLWAIRLQELFDRSELEADEPVLAAQQLLDSPLSRGLARLEELLTREQHD